jgi:hypothetical protein
VLFAREIEEDNVMGGDKDDNFEEFVSRQVGLCVCVCVCVCMFVDHFWYACVYTCVCVDHILCALTCGCVHGCL